MEATTQDRLEFLCKELVELLKVKRGSVEIHCDEGEPKALHITDTSIRFGRRGGRTGRD
jgi:hypothetical protein